MTRKATVKPVSSELSLVQNARLRSAMIAYLRDECGDNRTILAARLGRKQPSISDFLNQKGGAAYKTAQAFADLVGKNVADILGPVGAREGEAIEPPSTTTVSDYGYKALDRIGRALGFSAKAIERAQENWGRHGLEGMSDELARDLLAIAKRSIEDEQRALELDGFRRGSGSKAIEHIITDDDDDIGARPKKVVRR